MATGEMIPCAEPPTREPVVREPTIRKTSNCLTCNCPRPSTSVPGARWRCTPISTAPAGGCPLWSYSCSSPAPSGGVTPATPAPMAPTQFRPVFRLRRQLRPQPWSPAHPPAAAMPLDPRPRRRTSRLPSVPPPKPRLIPVRQLLLLRLLLRSLPQPPAQPMPPVQEKKQYNRMQTTRVLHRAGQSPTSPW